MKAWQVYLIGVFVLSLPFVIILNSFGYGTSDALGYDIGRVLVESSVIGGAILVFYYLIRSKYKAKVETKTAI